MGIRIGSPVESNNPRALSPESPISSDGFMEISCPRHGLLTVLDYCSTTRQLRYFVSNADLTLRDGPAYGETVVDLSFFPHNFPDAPCFVSSVVMHSSDGILFDPARPEVNRRIRVGSSVRDLLEGYGLATSDIKFCGWGRLGPVFVLSGVRGIEFGLARRDHATLKEERLIKEELLDGRLLDERLLTITVWVPSMPVTNL